MDVQHPVLREDVGAAVVDLELPVARSAQRDLVFPEAEVEVTEVVRTSSRSAAFPTAARLQSVSAKQA